MVAKGQKPRKLHQRSCISCRTTNDKRALIRFVRPAMGEIILDPTGRLAGRGAYLCSEQQCFDRARKGRLLDRALKTKLNDVDYQRLEEEFANQRDKADMV